MKYQVLAHVGNNQWQAIGIEDHFYKTYQQAKLSLQDTLENYGEDPNQYKITHYYEFKDFLNLFLLIVLFLIVCAASIGI